MSGWVVYLLICADGTTYIGVTNDIERRLQEHNAGRAAKYTRGRRPVELLGALQCPDRGEALRQEYRLKRLPPSGRRQAFAGNE